MTTAATEPMTHWHLDPDDTSVEFAVKTFWGLSTVHGRFDAITGTYETGADGGAIELTVDADTIDTGNAMRDKHLRADGFFDTASHPQIRFISSRVHEVEEGLLHVVGTLEAGGRKTTLEFPAMTRELGDEIEIEATTTVDRQQLGLSSGPLGMIAREVKLHVSARLGQGSVAPGRAELGDDRENAVHEALDRARRFWGPEPPADHPLSKEERLPMPTGATQELSRDLKLVPGDTHLSDDLPRR